MWAGDVSEFGAMRQLSNPETDDRILELLFRVFAKSPRDSEITQEVFQNALEDICCDIRAKYDDIKGQTRTHTTRAFKMKSLKPQQKVTLNTW